MGGWRKKRLLPAEGISECFEETADGVGARGILKAGGGGAREPQG